jgi:hypothetical protein
MHHGIYLCSFQVDVSFHYAFIIHECIFFCFFLKKVGRIEIRASNALLTFWYSCHRFLYSRSRMKESSHRHYFYIRSIDMRTTSSIMFFKVAGILIPSSTFRAKANPYGQGKEKSFCAFFFFLYGFPFLTGGKRKMFSYLIFLLTGT